MYIRLLAKGLAQSKHSVNVHGAGKPLPLDVPMKEVDSSVETSRYYSCILLLPVSLDSILQCPHLERMLNQITGIV